MTATIEQITALLPMITPYSMPADQTARNTLFDIACNRINQDAPGLASSAQPEAICWYIAHLLCNKEGGAGISSEHLGNWSVTYAAGEATPYLAEYNRIISLASFIGNCDTTQNDDIELADRYALDRMPSEDGGAL